MRYVNLVLCVLMLVFIGVQYNDPDGLLWMAIYLIPAAWAAIAALHAPLLGSGAPRFLLLASLAAAITGVIHYWPDTPGFWKQEVWYETETAREGIGMMIVLIVLLVVWLSGHMAGKKPVA